MAKLSRKRTVQDVYRRLILKYHKQGKDSTSLMNRLKEVSIKSTSKNNKD